METLALYDRDGRALGRTVERDGGTPQVAAGEYWWVCDVWIVNKQGEILIQRRSMNKPNSPGLWGESAGGAIQAEETREEGCARETREELGVELDFTRGALAFVYTGKTAHHDVWVFRMDVPVETLTLQAEEVMDARYASPDEVRRLSREGAFVPCGYLDQLLLILPVLTSAFD